jgi:histidine phosphotransfer protein HptB
MNTVFAFDEGVFLKLVAELGDEDTVEVLKVFLADTANKLITLETNSQARPLIKREAHSIKGSAGTFGFSELWKLAKELEFGAETMDSDRVHEALGGLRQAYEATRQFAQANLLNSSLAMAH